MAQKDLNSHPYNSPLDVERKVTAGAKTAEHQGGILFPFRFLLISLQSCIQCTWIFFPLHFLDTYS